MKRISFLSVVFVFLLTAAFPMPPALAASAEQPASQVQTYTVMVGVDNVKSGVSVGAFFPESLTIHTGDTVHWVQNANEIHTVTFLLPGQAIPEVIVPAPANTPPPGLMMNPVVAFRAVPANNEYDGSGYVNSGIMGKESGQVTDFSLTFTKPGIYPYLCVIHGKSMSGTITVTDPSQAVLSPAQVIHQAKVAMKKQLEKGRALIPEALRQVPKAVKNPDGTVTHHVLVGYMKGQIMLMSFFPRKLTVKQGDQVVWTFSKANDAPHTITFLNGADEPELIVPESQPLGPPLLLINPALALPSNLGVPLTRNGIFNSGLLLPGTTPPSYQLTIGNVSGSIPYLCLLHDTSGMVGSLNVVRLETTPVD